MKILQIFGAVVAVHALAFIFIFASPGCQSGPHNMPTPDATMPSASAESAPAPTFNVAPVTPVDLGTASTGGLASPTRPGSANAVAVTPPKAEENVAPVSTYTVERGDSLWSIAKKHGLSVSELAKANSVTAGTALKPGRKLIIPGKRGSAVTTAATTTPVATEKPAAAAHAAGTGEAVKHTVQVGESLGVIARKYQVSVGELAAANNITDPSKLRAGQQLVIPGFKSVGTRSAPKQSGVTKPAAPAAASATPAATTPKAAEPAPVTPHFDLTPPPPGQDLDAGLKPADTEVPTIKVEDPAASTPPKN